MLMLSVFLTLMTIPFRDPYYMEPDDYLLNYIANGSYGTEHSHYLIYIRGSIGLILKGLYQLSDRVNWYAVLLIGIIILEYAVLHLLIRKRTGSIAALLISCLFNALMVPIFFTYTVVAFLATGAGLFLLDEALLKTGCRINAHIPGAAAGIVLLYTGFALRADAFLPAAGILSPLLIADVLRCLKGRKKSGMPGHMGRGLLVLIAFGVLLAAGDQALEHRLYSGEPWKSMAAFNRSRTQVVDYPCVDFAQNEEQFRAIGVTETEYSMLYSWKFLDRMTFTPGQMDRIASIIHNGLTINRRLINAGAQLGTNGWFLILMPAFALLYVLTGKRTHRRPVSVLITVLWGLAVLGLLLIRLRFVARVAVPLSMLTVYGIFFTMSLKAEDRFPVRTRPAFRIILSAAALFCLLFFGFLYTKGYLAVTLPNRRPYGSPKYESIRNEIANNPSRLYVMDGYVLTMLYYNDHPVRYVRKTDAFLHVVRSGSWDSFSARYYDQLKDFTDNPDRLLVELTDGTRFSFVSQNISLTQRYLTEKAGYTGTPIVSFPEEDMQIYTF